ncbi:thioredoxin-disulfide reductase [Candidatus Poribacteria bacterium]|nr:thioredoxin-disulfide reductase [Candidatus Poribacteria bacterium]
MELREIVIIGAGPAGYAAGLYAGRAQLSPLLLTGREIGGQLSLTLDIENYPGYGGSSAGELIQTMQKQAESFGTEIRYDYVTGVDFGNHPFVLTTETGGEIRAKAVVICTGSSPRHLDVPGEELVGKGVSYCATCDGFFFREKRVVVVGGGDAAIEEGLFLTRFASEVHVVHRRDQLRASPTLQERAFANSRMHFVWNSVVEEILGDGASGVTSVRLRDVTNGATRDFSTDGVFIFIGHLPNTSLFEGVLDMDDGGYIRVDDHQQTSISGVFAGGDVHDHMFRQAITAAGAGAAAAIEAERFLARLGNRAYPGSIRQG